MYGWVCAGAHRHQVSDLLELQLVLNYLTQILGPELYTEQQVLLPHRHFSSSTD